MAQLVINGSAPNSQLNGQRIVLGVDPGTQVMGYGIVCGNATDTPHLVVAGALELTKCANHYDRLALIYSSLTKLFLLYKPTEMSIEAPFFGKNVQSMLKLGRAQGVAIAAATGFGVPVVEYSPREIKLAITGQGQASKMQVSNMLERMFPDAPIGDLKHQDATDALAAALCLYYRKQKVKTNNCNSWAKFIEQHPDRVQ